MHKKNYIYRSRHDQPNSNQINELVSFMEAHKPLATGLLSGNDGKLNKIALLAELSDKLNLLGVHKTGEEWLKVIFLNVSPD